MLRPEPTPQEVEEIKGQLMAYADLMRVAMEQVRRGTQRDLEDVHDQVLPAGVEVRSIHVPVSSNQGFPPSSPAPPSQTEDSEDEEELTALEQKVVFTDGFDTGAVFNDDNINYRGLMLQLHVRGSLTEETIDLLNKIPTNKK